LNSAKVAVSKEVAIDIKKQDAVKAGLAYENMQEICKSGMEILKKGPDALKELQVDIRTQDDWESLMSKPGLCVVDVYAAWCGPCKAVLNTFKKIKNENGDDLLNFATAESDSIDFLADYRGRSQPTFLFYGDGELVNAIHGCNGPLLIKSILSLHKQEHQILEGTLERKIFIDKEVNRSEGDEKQDHCKDEEATEEDEEIARTMSMRKISKSRLNSAKVAVSKEVAIAIIKPDAVKAGLADEIMQEICNAGMEILQKEERVLTKEEATEFYKQHEGTDHFESLIEFMSSGPCMTLVISKAGEDLGSDVIPEIRSLIGPTDVNMAKEEAPESLRAKYGTDSIQNALHSCDTSESAARELAFFYPDFNKPVVHVKQQKKRLQRTLALIRPNALRKRRDSIIKTIEDSGFLIAMQKEVQLTREQAEEFYSEHQGADYYESLISNMICGPSLALCLAREDAVQVWRNMLGPKDVLLANQPAAEDTPPSTAGSNMSLRQKFFDPEDEINPLHGADSETQVQREMNILFPVETTVAVIKPDAYEKQDEKDAIINKIKEAGFRISAQKEVNLTKDLASWFYKEHEGKQFFDSLTEYMSSGPTQFLILSREDAVGGFRSLLGPSVPEEAKQLNPQSLRAQFAKDEMKNAVHGSSSVSKVKEVIHEFFPDIDLDEKGVFKETNASAVKNKEEENTELEA